MQFLGRLLRLNKVKMKSGKIFLGFLFLLKFNPSLYRKLVLGEIMKKIKLTVIFTAILLFFATVFDFNSTSYAVSNESVAKDTVLKKSKRLKSLLLAPLLIIHHLNLQQVRMEIPNTLASTLNLLKILLKTLMQS